MPARKPTARRCGPRRGALRLGRAASAAASSGSASSSSWRPAGVSSTGGGRARTAACRARARAPRSGATARAGRCAAPRRPCGSATARRRPRRRAAGEIEVDPDAETVSPGSGSVLEVAPVRRIVNRMEIFVTGGSGYLGRALLSRLGEHSVCALARSDSAASVVSGLGARVVRGSLADVGVLRDAAAEADVTINLAQDNLGDTAALASAAADVSCPRLVGTSTRAGRRRTGTRRPTMLRWRRRRRWSGSRRSCRASRRAVAS